ncbi:MAG: Ig-like domain-containing protein [Patescibacteria group bacterium]|nr:Ig-like domain-containing protein [Patescibacteria group bacterium]
MKKFKHLFKKAIVWSVILTMVCWSFGVPLTTLMPKAPEAKAASTTVMISEVSADMGSATAEFVELYNASSTAINISGWKIEYSAAGSVSWSNKATIPTTTNLPAFGFYLASTANFDTASGVNGDTSLASGLALSGGHIRLTDGSTEIDKVGWGTAENPEGTAIAAHSAGQSLERKAFGDSKANDMATGGMDEGMGNGWDTDNNSFDFVVQASPNPQNSSSTEQPNMTGYDGAAGNGPMIMHTPINSAITGANLEITAQMGDPMTPINSVVAELHYMVKDGSPTAAEFTTASKEYQSNGFFKFTIPSNSVTTDGIYYYLKVVTNGGTAFMSANPGVDTASVGSGMTYADVAAKEAVVAINPFIVSVATAGDTFAISGTVTDDTPAAIENVLVMIEGTGYSATTSAIGFYSISVPNGIYDIVMIKEGYFEEMVNNIFVNNAGVTVDKTMYLGQGGGMTGDSEKPMVMWTGPMDGMSGIPAGMDDFKIFIGFSKDLASSTFDTASVVLTNNPSGSAVSGYTAEFNPTRTAEMPPENMDPYLGVISLPAGGLTENTTYYLIMDSTIRDTAGNSLQGNNPNGGHMISFTTGLAGGSLDFNNFGTGAMMPPFVAGTNPHDGAMNVMTNAKININFSDPMDSTSVNSTNIKLYKLTYSGYDETEIATDFSVSLDTSGRNATLIPLSALTAGSRYRVVVSGALKSATGIWMGDPGQSQNVSTYRFYQSGFEVGTSSDTTPPTVLGSWPANGDTGIDVNPGMMTIQFSEGMDPSTINSNTITLKRGTSAVTGNISYDPMSQSASFSPSVVLATNTDYTLTVTVNVTDSVGNAIDSNEVIIFTTTDAGDTTDPSIMFANGDEYGVAITFSESMNSANVADTANYGTSVLNPANYVIKWGDPSTVATSGTVIDLADVDAKFKYDGMGNTVMIDNLGLSYTAGKDYYINMASSTVSGAGATDLSGNYLFNQTTFQMPINNSFDTQGMLGPMMGGGGMMGPDMGMMGMMGASVFPMNGMAGQTTTYFVDVPTTKIIPVGGKIVLTFPVGFDVENAAKDPYSPVNNDINEWNEGTVEINSVAGNKSARTITITTKTSATQTNDFLCMDIKGIVNSSIPRGFETSGYTVDMKTMDADGNLLETITAMPFFINEGGSNNLEVKIDGVTSGDNGNVTVFLGSPMTGPMEQTVAFSNETSDTVTFSNLLEGQYMLFTEPTITLGSADYSGMPMPQPITVDEVGETKTISLAKENAGAVAAITVNITGEFGTDDIDVFAGSPTGFKVKTIADAGTNPNTILYLPAGNWMVGIGPAMPKGPMAGPPPMPDWMPPMPTQVVSNGSTAQELNISISTASMQIIGYVTDGVATQTYPDGTPIADAEAFAYQPMGMGMGSHTKTDTNGKFTLKVATAGTYSVGVFKPGLPGVPDKTVKVGANESIAGGDADGNSTADITADGALITVANQFIFKIQKSDYTISGKVTNGTNPVSYAPVWAYQPNGMGHAETMTDASGNYILYVSNGNWTVQSYIPSYGDSEPQTVVVNGASMTQNLSQDSSVTYYTISGTVTLNDVVQTYMPIRAVEYDSNGNYLGREYSGQTDALGKYSISVPGGEKYYRVDIWTPEFGEVELTVTDEVANSPANVEITGANKTGKDITIAGTSLNEITLAFANGGASQNAIINIDGVSGTPPKPTGFHKTIKLSALDSNSSVMLPDGDYMFNMDVPGLGGFTPTGENPVTVSGNATITFALPNSSTEIFTVTGTIDDETDPIEGAWVWMGNPTTGMHLGDSTDNSGVYSITVKAGNYKMGVEMPGYAPQQPADVTVSANAELNYALTATNQSISGRIYADTSADGYTIGEEIANGWVWVEETTTKQIAGAPTDIDGTFSIGVVNGTYILRGVGEGYQETRFGNTITVAGSGSTENNINLTADSNWSSKLKSRPMTPASGGTLDDTLSTGTGIKVVAPPNALGSGTSAGTIKTKEVSSVSRTSSAEPLGGKGKEITAQNNSGQAITTLNSDIEIELNYYKEDITDAGMVDFDKLKTLTNSYWDVSINDWVSLSTTKQAYTKAVGAADNAEWTAQPDFDSFVDDIATYGDYKITLKSTTAHLTIFGATTPSDLSAPATPSDLTNTASNGSVALSWTANTETDLLEYQVFRGASADFTCNNDSQINTSSFVTNSYTDTYPTANSTYTYYYKITAVDDSSDISDCTSATTASYTYTAPAPASSGNSSPVSTTYCTNVTYDQWQDTCVNNLQYRNIKSKSPAGCTLTSEQESQRKKLCGVALPEIIEETKEKITEIVGDTSQATQEFAQKIITIAEEAAEVLKANVNALLGKLGFKRDLAKEQVSVKKYVKTLIKNAAGLPEQSKHALTNFIAYGTKTTLKLGEGERAGVVNSYKATFGKLPIIEAEWNDVIKIANGRWPSETNKIAETNATETFKEIYLKSPDRNNAHDDAAVTVMAYGLRPADRNLDSEKAGIKIFKAIYGYNPSSATDWDAIRAIAYSGATR